MKVKAAPLLALSLAGLAVALLPASAAEANLSAAEIEAMMAGNSIAGFYPDGVTEYRQNNHTDGTFIINVKGDKIRTLEWRAVEKDGVGHYCEDWSPEGWGELCFTVTRADTAKPEFTNEAGKTNIQNWTEGFIDLNFAD
ncbi:hypothetical protein [Cucumibacter marinus]|uniref:hypothetical protein n=1 Tax=Cucumibacter marinus TaxID=1121252 RepID=UPI000413CEEE|nr:hypothetical protein [Cucumibacter marinus]